MADSFTPEKRSEIMSKIRSKNTVAERLVFSYLRKQGVYFQSHYKNAPGKPDIALPRKKRAVFIDGDFWHGRTFERLVKSRPADDYWIVKISVNKKRDIKNAEELKKLGWVFIRVWEKDIKTKRTQKASLEMIKDFLQDTN